MANKLFNAVLLLFVHYASTQVVNSDSNPDTSNTPVKVSYLDSTFLTKLELVTLDTDKAFGEHATPEIEFEDRVKKQTYGRPRSDYFNRIRGNYRTIQQRVGSQNFKETLSASSKLFSDSTKNVGQLPSVETFVPSIPVHFQVKSKSPSEYDSQKYDSAKESTTKELKEIHIPQSSFASRNAEVKISKLTPPDTSSEEQGEPLTGVLLLGGDERKSQTGRSGPPTAKANEKLLLLFTEAYKELLFDSYSKPEDIETVEGTDSEVRSRMLGELLYSESAFDKLSKIILRNAKWVLDSDLSPSSVFGKFDVSNLFRAIRPKASPKVVNQKQRALKAKSQVGTEATRKGKLERSDDVTRTQSTKHDQNEATPAKETILSAYTNMGVPVTLRIGPEAGDPYRFLRRILTPGEVSLFVQLKPQSDAEAVGKETAQSGSENGSLPASSLYIDLSDVNQRNSFLLALRKFETDPN